MTASPTLAQALFDELTKTVRGEVYRRGDHQYVIAGVCGLLVVLISPVPTQVSRAYKLIQWKRSEQLQGRRTSP
jgi:hypothetical protein